MAVLAQVEGDATVLPSACLGALSWAPHTMSDAPPAIDGFEPTVIVEETGTERLWRRMREDPLTPIGTYTLFF